MCRILTDRFHYTFILQWIHSSLHGPILCMLVQRVKPSFIAILLLFFNYFIKDPLSKPSFNINEPVSSYYLHPACFLTLSLSIHHYRTGFCIDDSFLTNELIMRLQSVNLRCPIVSVTSVRNSGFVSTSCCGYLYFFGRYLNK